MIKLPNKTTKKPSRTPKTPTSTTQTAVVTPSTPSTTKRKAISNPASPNSTPQSKIQAMGDSKPITIDELKLLLSEQTSKITQQLSDQMNSLGNEIKESLQTQILQTNQRIDSIQSNVDKQLTTIQSELTGCVDKITNTDNEIARFSKLNELRINGIAHTDGENLRLHFNAIAQVIGFDASIPMHIPSLSRTYSRNKTTKKMEKSSTFVAKFIAKHIRDEFYSAYLTKIANNKPITTEMINLPQGGRLLISESLTMTNSKLFSVCMSLKKEKKLSQVYTQDGQVCIKASKTSKATIVRSQRDIDLFLACIEKTNNGQQPQSSDHRAKDGATNTITTSTSNNNSNTAASAEHTDTVSNPIIINTNNSSTLATPMDQST